MSNKFSKNNEFAIKVENLSKTFRIPHEKIKTMRGAFVSMFKKKTYEEFQALDNVSFEVKKGEFFGIIGRNGSGKSTLLKILAGIYQPDKGTVKINGMISPFLELGIGFNPELSGRDNVYLNATVLGLTRREIDRKFDSIVKFSELERFIDQKLKNYSSGMQVRLAFSVAIHANRDILLMDEVLAVGDSNFQSKCLEEFNKYRNFGKTVILVTHDIAVMERYCDRALLLRDGKIRMIGKANEVANKYIYENISDEEKRLMKEQKEVRVEAEKDLTKLKDKENKKQEKENKKKMVEITSVKFLDKDGKERSHFNLGEDVQLVMYCKFFQEVKNPEFGIILKDDIGKSIFATNTIIKNVRSGIINRGKRRIIFYLNEVPIIGNVYVSAAVSEEKAVRFYDWKDRIAFAHFSVVDNFGGLIRFKHSIFIE